MIRNTITVFIAFFSPSGSTRHVAEVIEKQFQELGIEVALVDLSECTDCSRVVSQKIKASKKNTCLFIGSPVYVSHAVPMVMEFIAGLEDNAGPFAVPFVTWGGASSGISLFEMSQELSGKGFTILGAAKILGVHSLMWQLDNPLGKGHPNAKDDDIVRDWVVNIVNKLCEDNPKGILPSDLAYQSEEVHKEMEKIGLKDAKTHMPKRTVDQKLCTECRICADICPTDSIVLSPYPEFGDGCIFCFNCLKTCPEEAILANLSEIWQRIRDRATTFSERPYTQTFL